MTPDGRVASRRLTRAQEGRLISGVCAGLGNYTRIDPVVFRVAFALLVLATGVGLILYAGAFLLMAAPDGGPGKIEQVGDRLFDGDTVLALLGVILGAGTLLGIAGDRGSGDGVAVAVVFTLALLTARSRGVGLVQVARGLPERVKGRPLSSWTPPSPPPPPPPPAPPSATSHRFPEGMVDLARLSPPATAEPTVTGPHGTEPWRATAPAPARRRPRSYLTALTLTAAVAVAAVLRATVGHRLGFDQIQIILAGALIVVATGLFAGAWFGRDRTLVIVGAIMSLALASTSVAGDPSVARRTHAMTWWPTDTTQAQQSHTVFLGEGVVDLTSVPLVPGRRVRVTAQVTFGVLAVRVPAGARVEVDGQAFLGDITVDGRLTSGPRAKVRRVLEPEGRAADAPVIELRIRSKIGDMEVTRVPA